MRNKSSIIFSILFLVASAFAATFYYQSVKLKKENRRLQNSITSLESELETAEESVSELEDERDEMQEELDKVQHFDNGGFRNQYSVRSGGVSYTGDVIQTQIDGEFEGWEGETIFKMMKGTIWQQSSYDYTYHYAYMPDVLIYSKSGSYYMRVEGVNDEIMVRRIK